MIDKQDVFKVGKLIRDAEKSLAKLHKFSYAMADKYKEELGLTDDGDFTTLSGGTNKPPPPNP